MPADDSYATISLKSDPSFQLTFEEMTVHDELGRPFEIELSAYSIKPKTDLTSLLGGSVTVKFTAGSGSQPTYFNGILGRIVYLGLTGGAYRYKLELRPWIWLLSHVQDCCIYQDKSPWSIIKAVVQAAGFSDAMSDNRRNDAGSTTLDYCVQYCETSFAFITRLMEQYGMYYYFEHADDKHTLVIADDPNSHPQAVALPYQRETTDMRVGLNHVWNWSADASLQPGAYTFRDYNFTTPSADLTARATKAGPHAHGTNEIYSYPGQYTTADDGKTLAGIRMEEMNTSRQIMSGTTNARAIGSGARFTLSKAPGTTSDQTYVVVTARSSFGHGEGKSTEGSALTDTFRCVFTAVPSDLTYRLKQLIPQPRIRGPQTARVVGESGQEITTDNYGRVKLKFFWDRSAVQNENASCWIRVSQSWAGNLWGGMIIPRIGQEVIVEFLDGNPDRPIVTGQVYNGSNAVPYPLPDNKTRSTMKSRSTLGGGGFNEIRFEDKKGSEEVFFQAQKDYNKVVLNNETVAITQDTTTTVKQGNRSVTVSQGNDSHTVSQGNRSTAVDQGNHTTTVSKGNHQLTVSLGNHTIDVSAGSSTLQAAQSITLQCGASSIKIEPAQITLSSPQITLSGTAAVSIQAPSVTAEGQASATVSAGGMLTLSGGTVMIN